MKYLNLVFVAFLLSTVAQGTGVTLPASGGGGGSGDVTGPGSSTDNAVARFDGATGKILQNSGVTIDNSNDMTVNDITVSTPSNIYALSHDSFADYVANEHLLPGAIDHGLLLGLADDDHDGYFWLTGRAGGQTGIGGTAAGDDLGLTTTSNATLGQFDLAGLGLQMTSAGTAPNAMSNSQNIDLQTSRTAATQTITLNAATGIDNAILSGKSNHIIGGAASYWNTIVGGYYNHMEGSSIFYGNTMGGALNTLTGANRYSTVFGYANTLSGGFYNFIGGDHHNSNNKSWVTLFGSSSLAENNYEFILADGGGGAAANTHNGMRLNPATGIVDVGHYIAQAAAGSTPEIRIHTANANQQSNYMGIQAHSAITDSFTDVRGVVKGTIAATDVRKLNAVPQSVIAAAGASKVIKIEEIVLFMDWEANVYDSVGNGDDFQLQCATSNNSIVQIETVGFMNQGNDEQWGTEPDYSKASPSTPGGFDLLTCDNEAIELTVLVGELATADNDANGDSPLKYAITYTVWDLLN